MAKNQRTVSARVAGEAAGGGTWSFVFQRGTALVLLVLCPWFALAAPLAVRDGYEGARRFFLDPIHAGAAGALVIAACAHMYLGVTEIIEDYFHKPAGKTALLMLNALVCFLAAAAGVVALVSLWLGI